MYDVYKSHILPVIISLHLFTLFIDLDLSPNVLFITILCLKVLVYTRGGQQVDHDRPVNHE